MDYRQWILPGKGGGRGGPQHIRYQQTQVYASDSTDLGKGCDVFACGWWRDDETWWECWHTVRPLAEVWESKAEEWTYMGSCRTLDNDEGGHTLHDPQLWGKWGIKLRREAVTNGKRLQMPKELWAKCRMRKAMEKNDEWERWPDLWGPPAEGGKAAEEEESKAAEEEEGGKAAGGGGADSPRRV